MKIVIILLVHLISAQDVFDNHFLKDEIKAFSRKHASELTKLLVNVFTQQDDPTSRGPFDIHRKLTHLQNDSSMSKQCLQDAETFLKTMKGKPQGVSQSSNWAKQSKSKISLY